MSNNLCEQLDVAVIGFGPAGISLACAFDDWKEKHGGLPTGPVRFFEKSAGTTWHGEFLLRGTDINHHIYRDLVTPRDPRSKFSFAMYLHSEGRLYSFGLLGRPPSRAEWSRYLTWAAAQLADYVSYNSAVTRVEPIVDGDKLSGFFIHSKGEQYHSKRLVLSQGSIPKPPEIFQPLLGSNVFHTAEYLSRMGRLSRDLPKSWLVLGSGQSAGEAVSDLIQRRDDILVHSVHRGIGFKIGQLGQFPNQVFLPEQVDYFHALPGLAREQLFAEVKATNYAGIDTDESQALYSFIYEDWLEGRRRLQMHSFKTVTEVTGAKDKFIVELTDVFTGDSSTIEVAGIVLGTGFEQPAIPPLLAEVLPWLTLGEDGGVQVGRDYRLALKAQPGVEIFANGLSERAHGISDAQSFSLVADRSARILRALTSTRPGDIEASRRARQFERSNT